jgi:hypothetical protein
MEKDMSYMKVLQFAMGPKEDQLVFSLSSN